MSIEILLGALTGAACSVSGMVTCYFIQRSNQQKAERHHLDQRREAYLAGFKRASASDHLADSIADQVRRRQWPIA